jgi:histidinol phosphatase-like enzyme (inositol monophosphatase family)
MPTLPASHDLIAIAHRLADAAGAAILPHFRNLDAVEAKKHLHFDFDPVTAGDKAAEAAIRAVLAELRPDDGIMGEEEGYQAGSSGMTWVIDPIDGTRAFMSGIPLWTTLIALHDGERPVLGMIDQSYLNERVWACGADYGARLRGRTHALKTRTTLRLEDATLCATDPRMFRLDGEKAAFRALSHQVRLARFGTDGYAYAMLALGHVDLVVESLNAPYDVMSHIPIIEAAGGVVTDWAGGDAQRGGQIIAAANPALHEAALAMLRGAAREAPPLPFGRD